MLICHFPGCDMLQGHGGPHQAWRRASQSYAPLAEQRTPAQIRRDNARAARRQKAESIARDVLALNLATSGDAANSDAALRHLTYSGDRVREMLTAAALQALTETENAR